MSSSLILTLPEVAELLVTSESQVRRLIKHSGLPYVQVRPRGAIRFVREDVMEWWKKHTKGGDATCQ